MRKLEYSNSILEFIFLKTEIYLRFGVLNLEFKHLC